MAELRNMFTDEELDLIAAVSGIEVDKVRCIGWLARLKLETDPARDVTRAESGGRTDG